MNIHSNYVLQQFTKDHGQKARQIAWSNRMVKASRNPKNKAGSAPQSGILEVIQVLVKSVFGWSAEAKG